MEAKRMCRTCSFLFFFVFLPSFTEEASVTYPFREEQDSGTYVGLSLIHISEPTRLA